MELLAAMVAGDGQVGDVTQELKNEGIDTPEALLVELGEGLKEREASQRRPAPPLDVLHMGSESSPAEVARIVQRVPQVPFTLNGTTYDPEDISRFNGRELHFIPSGDHLLVVDDREMMTAWRQFLYFERWINEDNLPSGAAPKASPATFFHSDAIFNGHVLKVQKNTGWHDLTKKDMVPFRNWNDHISSFWMHGTQVAELYEHHKWQGQTYTAVVPPHVGNVAHLSLYGWNDRATGVATW
ncbi:hypothetical protein [Streptomyces sp. V1I6]|uniref:hypothetical protein n=1 Tax=Streptomyces sp. V1I6 TaxID=3042273 RepID=UPI0027D918EF|nr:hypothetical protein [Streptomyces sp. V1I6]